MERNLPYFSLVVPVWNESESILPLVQRIDKTFKSARISYEVIFIDDHSTDNTTSVIKEITRQFPVVCQIKPTSIPKGKAYSLLYGFSIARANLVGMIDGDLQYPPEVLPAMIDHLKDSGLVVARRSIYEDSFVRKIVSHGFSTIFARLLHGLPFDVQSGLKVMRKELVAYVNQSQISPWTLDLQLFTIARDLGDSITELPIKFDKRANGKSKVNIFKSSWEIGLQAIKLKFKPKPIYPIHPNSKTMQGAGVVYQQKKLITHTTLSPNDSAIKTIIGWQKLALILLAGSLGFGIVREPLITATSVIAILSLIYFVDVAFSLFLALRSIFYPPEINFSPAKLVDYMNKDLPTYTILSPLYREAQVLPDFIESMKRLTWPKEKLEVLLLLEEDDTETITAANHMDLPDFIRIIVVPNSQPKTKPKACNYGLSFARGEYLVIYDAEDRPEADQLLKAYAGFMELPDQVACLQAKLNYYNPKQNLLTMMFTVEYSLWFDLILTGLQSINTMIPLGGTSNHFKTKILKSLKGWDPFNVTEDCDLGIRLFKQGYQTAIIDSTTYEEANSNVINWFRQRSRWIKGYFQTFWVHNRQPVDFLVKHGIHAWIFQLIIGARISFILINPLLWLTTISYFAFYSVVGPLIESVFPPLILYMAVISLVFGNFIYLYSYMIGCAKRGYLFLVKYVFFIPGYWLMTFVAANIAAVQLITKPHYWEKTIHGLHLKPATVTRDHDWLIGPAYVGIGIIANLTNFFFTYYLAKTINVESYSEVTFFISILSIASIPFSAITITIANNSAFLFGKKQQVAALNLVKSLIPWMIGIGSLVSAVWVGTISLSQHMFQLESALPFLLFTPIWLVGLLNQTYLGYFQGKIAWLSLGLMVFVDTTIKLLLTPFLVANGNQNLVIGVLPMSMLGQLIVAKLMFDKETGPKSHMLSPKFDLPFFFSTMLVNASSVAFMGVDVILAKHYLPAGDAGYYGLLSLVGKLAFYTSSIWLPLLVPIMAKNQGLGKNNERILGLFTGLMLATVGSIYFGFSWQQHQLLPLLFGVNFEQIWPYLPVYMLAIGIFSAMRPLLYYFQTKKRYAFAISGLLACLTQMVLIHYYHANLNQFVMMMSWSSISLIGWIGIIYLLERVVNIRIFFSSPKVNQTNFATETLRILIFNWRDIRHKWAGGSEIYLHELAKQWVKDGHQVTLFCSNDGSHMSEELIDGVKIIRKGGFYSVYVWAMIYYFTRFKNQFDIIIDTENGIPFFTPLYAKETKFLLLYHVHQEVFRQHLGFPLANIACYLEAVIMPHLYQHQPVITISESSKHDIQKLNLGINSSIDIVEPGVYMPHPKLPKTSYPLFSYVGRLKPYKNVDKVILAFREICEIYPSAQLVIAGLGESLSDLKALTMKLKLTNRVNFLGKVSEVEKAKLLSTIDTKLLKFLTAMNSYQ